MTGNLHHIFFGIGMRCHKQTYQNFIYQPFAFADRAKMEGVGSLFFQVLAPENFIRQRNCFGSGKPDHGNGARALGGCQRNNGIVGREIQQKGKRLI